MARYSPELLAALRYRYEQTDQPMNALAADFEIGVTTLQTLVRKNGWTPRSQRVRHCPPTLREMDEAEPVAAAPEPHVALQTTPAPALPLSGEGSDAGPADGVVKTSAPSLSKAARLEALVEKEIAAEEATRAVLGIRPRSRNDAERCARTISKLTQTLQTIQKLRGDGDSGARADDDPPRDMDEFREQLARRIRGFIEHKIGAERMALNGQIARLTDDEVKELIAVGHERGMRALLQPAEEKEASEADVVSD